jgi:hypothetical protein
MGGDGRRWEGMGWDGMVWYGMAWYGMAWYGMVWHGMVWYGMVWYGMVWHGMDGRLTLRFILPLAAAAVAAAAATPQHTPRQHPAQRPPPTAACSGAHLHLLLGRDELEEALGCRVARAQLCLGAKSEWASVSRERSNARERERERGHGTMARCRDARGHASHVVCWFALAFDMC